MRTRSVTLVLALYCPALPLAAQGLQYEGGLSVASGTYFFTERTTSWSVFTGVAWTKNRVTVRASLPVHLQNTTLVAFGHGGTLPTGGSSSGVVGDSGTARKGHSIGAEGMGTRAFHTVRGRVEVPPSAVTGYEAAVGDPVAQVSWRALDGRRTGMSISVLAKAPVADTATFGTGQWDIGSSVTMSQTLSRRIMVGLELSYWKLGDLPTLDLRDQLSGAATLSYLGWKGWGGGISGSAGTSSLAGYTGPLSIGGFVMHGTYWGAWTAGGAVGLSETTPDFTLTLNWNVAVIKGF